MGYGNMLRFQKCLYFNSYLSIIWFFVTLLMIWRKVGVLDHLTKYLSVTVFTLFLFIEYARLYLGNYGNVSSRVPELAGFLMLTALMQLPLVSYFLFNPFLFNTPIEFTLNVLLWSVSVLELIFGYFALRNASLSAKNLYLAQRLQNQ